jgi:hypothetical protein
LQLSLVTPGTFEAEKFDCRVKGWSKTFSMLQSRAAIQGQRLHLASLALAEGLQLTAMDIGLSDAVQGRVDVECHAEAFGGEIRVQAQVNPGARDDPLEASGTLSNLAMAPLAAFLGIDAAGGVLQQGKFSFRGEPSHPSRGSASVRVEASNFQWESRQWDSLVLGATLVDRRIQIPEFSLRQGKNGLVLTGEMQWPSGGSPWWKSDFGVNVTANVENLTELSALLLPEFTYVAGALTVDGAVRSQAGKLGGALIVTGAKLTWRSAPIDELHAAIKLHGKDVELLNFELARGGDFLRGHGTLWLGDGWSYQGECRGQIADLARYSSLLEPPLQASAYSGGVQGHWSGKGAAEGHQGTLDAQFQQMRPLKESAWWPQALGGEVRGSYGPDGWRADYFRVETPRAIAQGTLVSTAEAVRVANLRIQQEDRTALEGSFVFPREFWARWTEPGGAWQALEKMALECSFSAAALDLARLASFPGVPPGLEGKVDGSWKWKGSRESFSGEGALGVRDFAFGTGEGRLSAAKSDLTLDAMGLRAQNLEWESGGGRYIGYAHVRRKAEQELEMDVAVSSQNAVWKRVAGLRFPLVSKEESGLLRLAPVTVRGGAVWRISGPVKDPVIKGELTVREIDFGGVPDLRAFWSRAEGARRLEVGGGAEDWRGWKLDLKVNGVDSVKVSGTSGAARVQMQAVGTLATPELQGEVRLVLSGAVGGMALELEPLLLRFSPGREPELEIRAKGAANATAFSVSAVGPLSQPKYEYSAEAPLTVEKLRSVFEEGKAW